MVDVVTGKIRMDVGPVGLPDPLVVPEVKVALVVKADKGVPGAKGVSATVALVELASVWVSVLVREVPLRTVGTPAITTRIATTTQT